VEARPTLEGLAGLSILVVDDTDTARDALRFLLEALGAVVMTACDGREALELLVGNAADVVLCDLRMPRLDGYDYIRELRGTANRTPVVAVSALASPQDLERTKAAGFEGHVTKPFDETDIVAAVSAVLAH
jgi:two-component system CheB/CheR fusion protein